MSFLGLSGPPTPENAFLQNVDIAVARNAARDVILRNRVRRMNGLGWNPFDVGGDLRQGGRGARPYHPPHRGVPGQYPLQGLGDLGATGPYRQGTRAWWQWYATVYLPQYYGQAKIQQIIYQSPYYQQFGTPFGYTPSQPYYYQPNPTPYYAQYQQPYYQPSYGSSYDYGYNNAYYNQAQAQYTQYLSEQGQLACQQNGGYWDFGQQTCVAQGGQGYVQGGSPPNVVGIPESLAISTLNSAGYNVWELNVDGQSRGAPIGYSANRVLISVTNGVVTAQAVG